MDSAPGQPPPQDPRGLSPPDEPPGLSSPHGPPGLSPPDEPPGWRAVGEDPLERDPSASVGWDIMLWIGLGMVALTGVFTIVAFFTGAFEPAVTDDPVPQNVTFERATLYFSVAINAVLFAVVPILWVAGTRQGRWRAVKPYFQLHRPLPNIAAGVVGGIVMAGAIIALFYVASLLGLEAKENALERQLAGVLTIPLAIAISLQAGITEEILFRGLIQRRIGWLAQGPIFGLFHLTQDWIGFVATTLIGLLFGYLIHRKVSMYAVMAAHVAYDMVLLGLFLAS